MSTSETTPATTTPEDTANATPGTLIIVAGGLALNGVGLVVWARRNDN